MSLCNDRCPECQRKIFEEAMKPKKKKCKDCGGEYEERSNWPIRYPYPLAMPFIATIPQDDPGCPIEIAKNGWWSTIPPRCTCGLFICPDVKGTWTDTKNTKEGF